ncbi:MAG: DMT family transporter [Pirellulales bacterium]|nr:DMT family transporter [Pirellulales bacterium]
MLLTGVIYGLLAALGQSVSFLFSRRYIVKGHGDSVRLLAIGHVMMGAQAAVILPFCWDSSIDDTGRILVYGVWATVTYLLGQVGFLAAIRRTEVSRVSPLLGLKVAAVAPISMWLLSAQIAPLQWVAIAMSIAGGFLLKRIGGWLPVATVFGTILAVIMFALSDVGIIKLVQACGDGLRASICAVSVSYIMCGLIGLVLLPWYGSRRSDDWLAAAPYAVLWLPSMFALFTSLAMCGAVLGNIVLSTRGLFSIALGVLLARGGMHHLEQHVARDVLVRRTAAAILVVAAIGLYAWGASQS